MDYSDATWLVDIMSKLVEIKFNELCENNNVCVYKVGIVKSYNSTTSKAYVTFPSNPDNDAVLYSNKTGSSLSAGDKVYVFHKFGKEGQGWILIKA